VNSLGLFCGFGKRGLLHNSGLLRCEEGRAVTVVLNWDGMVTPVLYQIDCCSEISSVLENYWDMLWQTIVGGSFIHL
jgi:hypothetical protein